jgi:hypothetical protein
LSDLLGDTLKLDNEEFHSDIESPVCRQSLEHQHRQRIMRYVSVISGTGAAIFTAVVVKCNDSTVGGCADLLHPCIWSCMSGLVVCLACCNFANFIRLPPKMWPSWPGLSLVTRAVFTLMTPRQSNSPPNGKVQTHREARQAKSKVKSVLIVIFAIEVVHKEFILAGQTVSFSCYCYVLG